MNLLLPSEPTTEIGKQLSLSVVSKLVALLTTI